MDAPITTRGFAEALAVEFLTAVDAVVGGLTLEPSSEPVVGTGWRVPASASGDLQGALTAWVDRAGGETIAQRVMGMDVAPDEATIIDMLGEMWGQAAGALSLKNPFTGVELALSGADAAECPADAALFELRAGDAVIARLAVGGSAVPVAAAAPARTTSPSAAASTGAVPSVETMDAVLDIDLPLIVRFARTVMTMKALSALGPGSIVDMERSPDEPVQLLVGERMIARGEVVVVGGHYGVRVTELVSPGDRARALEA